MPYVGGDVGNRIRLITRSINTFQWLIFRGGRPFWFRVVPDALGWADEGVRPYVVRGVVYNLVSA